MFIESKKPSQDRWTTSYGSRAIMAAGQGAGTGGGLTRNAPAVGARLLDDDDGTVTAQLSGFSLIKLVLCSF